MCGITGLVNEDPRRSVDRQDLKKMCNTLVHRGPDDEGFYIEGNVGLAIRRLSVIDLVTGHQPISNGDGSIWIVFNGEVYNFPELRRELEQKGHEFSTRTDTETIVHSYEEWGDDCVNRLNGMFAFAIWDRPNRKLLLARDRLGIKPLYYYQDDRCLVFGSELKAILQCDKVPRALDHEALDAFLTYEYVPAPMSMFKGIRKLPAGHLLVLQDGKASIRQYWDARPEPMEGTEDELGESLYDLLKDAVRMRLMSDVPLGMFLSGGVDSSIIVCMMSEVMDRPVQTFSIGFDDPSYNELSYARVVARHFGTDHHELVIKPDVVNLVDNLVSHLDEPMADVSIFPTYLVSKLAREKVTVVLSGDGGDELFAGYDWYLADRVERYYRWLPALIRHKLIPSIVSRVPPSAKKKGLVNKATRFVEGSVLPYPLRHYRWNTFLTEEGRAQLYSDELVASNGHRNTDSRFRAYIDEFEDSDPLWQQQYADIKTYLVDDILVKVDRMSMANSLEARTPFLDHRVVEFAAGLPSRLKLRGLGTKYLLKRSVATRLPQEILNRGKEGFSIPMKNWLRQELRPMMEDVLSAQRIQRGGLFNPRYTEALKTEHLAGTANHAHLLWSLMIFEIWREKYLGR